MTGSALYFNCILFCPGSLPNPLNTSVNWDAMLQCWASLAAPSACITRSLSIT
ncbi:hypothetical protein COCON_G00232490 [Conger conger]|uniref:Uncharacterized protein n=1 Tax=Conger conger TaxID=82655 RepID=A0A9Q1CW26_CONCO|nr:hypothetical protein COCON_G00232490 [Conger conger]